MPNCWQLCHRVFIQQSVTAARNSCDGTRTARLQSHLLRGDLAALATGGIQVNLVHKVGRMSQFLVVPVVRQAHALVSVWAAKDSSRLATVPWNFAHAHHIISHHEGLSSTCR